MKQKLFTLFAAVIIAANAMAQDVSAFTNQTITVEGVSFKMIAVEGGTFTMGATSEQGSDAYDNEKPTHSVTLSDYYIGETEVTQALWYAVMGYKPTSGGSQWSSNYGLGDNYPAYYISWDDCQAFITKLNTLTGKTFRMPTEAEWEYAARGGNKSQGYKYSGSNTIDDVAWYYDNSGIKSHTVGTKAANELGIYDMSGNLWEWCSDWYSRSYYSSSAQTNPTGPSSGSGRVRRGGYWYNSARTCRVSYRNNFAPSHCDIVIGLRLVLVPYYNIIVTASEGGTATGDGKYYIGETATLTATPNEYYEFEKWSDGNTENPRTITVTQDSVFEAIFVENPKYTITLHAENGIISGAESGKQYYEGTALTLTATPNQGYAFAQWSDGNTDNPRTITVTQDSTLTATFALTQHTITLVAENGTISGATSGTKYDYGTELTLTATGNTGYTFSQWSDGVTTTERTLILTQDTTFTAEFTINSYVIETTAGEGGSATGGASYNHGAEVILQAIANTGYDFVNWTKDGEEVSTSATYTFTATAAGAYKANFQKQQFTLTLVAENGTISGATSGTKYDYGTELTLTATSNTGYTFSQWSDGVTTAERTIILTQDTTFTALFTINSYVIETTAGEGGSATGGASYNHGAEVILQAIANTGYDFVNWTKDGEEVSTSATYTFTATAAGAYKANFQKQQFTLTLVAENGTISGATSGTKYDYGTELTLTATGNIGYTFSQWSDGVTTAERSIILTQDSTLTALFTINSYVIETTAGEGGSATGGASYNHGAEVILQAIANTGYDFVNWTKDGEEVSTSATYTFTATAAGAYKANFQKQQFTLTLVAENGTISGATSGTKYDYGTELTLTATGNTGYTFSQWSDGVTTAERTIILTQDTTFTAEFTINSYVIETTAGEGGNATGGASYNHGAEVTLQAIANTGYDFVNWTKDGEEVSTSATYTFTATAAGSYKANFQKQQFTLTLVTENGTISGATSGTKYDYGTELTLTATGNTGYTFSQWSDGITTAERTIILTQDTTFTAEFAPIMFTITATANNEAYGSVTGGDEYQEGETATLIATPNEGYEFVKWTDANGNESEDATLTFVVTEDATYTAIFQAKSPETGVVESVLRDAECEVRKVIENGQVIIIRDGVRYNILGAQMK